MPKNIVLCCDGTANEFAKNRTNVIKLYSTLVHDTPAQVTYYHPGIGTMEPFGSLSPVTRWFTRVLGMAVGYGLENDIRDAYAFLMETYEAGDSVYLFGFSRGAFTVRVLASLIRRYGMIRKGNEPLVPYAIRMMTGIDRADRKSGIRATEAKDAYFSLADEFKRTMSCAQPRLRFVGVWDTVSSVGWVDNPLHVPDEANNPDIEIGRHAVSIDERRAFFRTHMWQPPKDPAKAHGPQDCMQVWFPGVHCDVGGGYPECESGLSARALEWMLEEAKAAGLVVDAAKQAEVLAVTRTRTPHESLKGFWNIAELVPKRHWNWTKHEWKHRMNLWRRRTMPEGSLVHDSAYEMGAEYQKKFPEEAQRVSTRGRGMGSFA